MKTFDVHMRIEIGEPHTSRSVMQLVESLLKEDGQATLVASKVEDKTVAEDPISAERATAILKERQMALREGEFYSAHPERQNSLDAQRALERRKGIRAVPRIGEAAPTTSHTDDTTPTEGTET